MAVTTEIDITIKVLFFTAFQFIHHAVEIWKFGRLQSFESSTEDNGTHLRISGQVVPEGFRIFGMDGPYLTSQNLLTSNALWNSRIVRERKMIDVQRGGEVGLVVIPIGNEWVSTPNGPVSARRFDIITPNYAGSLYFDAGGSWVKGLIEQKGEILEYALVS